MLCINKRLYRSDRSHRSERKHRSHGRDRRRNSGKFFVRVFNVAADRDDRHCADF